MGELYIQRCPDPLPGLRGPISKGRGGKGEKGERRGGEGKETEGRGKGMGMEGRGVRGGKVGTPLSSVPAYAPEMCVQLRTHDLLPTCVIFSSKSGFCLFSPKNNGRYVSIKIPVLDYCITKFQSF